MNSNNKRIIYYKVLISILISLVFLFLIQSKYIYIFFVWPVKIDNTLFNFVDWSVIWSAIDCKNLGYDVYLNNPCDLLGRTHVYSGIFLNLPLYELIKKFYIIYFPFILIFIFIFTLVSFFQYNQKKDLLFIFILCFSSPTIQVIERLNTDLIIFFLIIGIAFFENIFILFSFAILSSAIKYYPIFSAVVFFLKEKSFFYLIIFFFIVLLVFYLDYDNYFKALSHFSRFTPGTINSFSINSIPVLLKSSGLFNIFILYKIKSTLIIFFIYFFLVMIFLFFFYIYFKYRLFFLKKFQIIYKNFSIKLFIISGFLVSCCYLFFPNSYYREIFILCLIPYSYNQYLKNNNNLTVYLFYLIIFKILISTVLNSLIIFLDQNHYNNYQFFLGSFALLKYLIDFLFICFLTPFIFLLLLGYKKI
jgi:hypothetical protein